MKKILFSLVALVCGMSMNAQVMKVMKDGVEVAKYYGADFEFVFEEASGWSTGSAKRTGNIDVNWVQLWENGPKFAEYNVGAENNKAEDYGGYYCWGGSQDKVDDHNEGSSALTGDDDTATKLWGSAWRMPTSVELEALINSTNCTVEWIDGTNKKYNNTTVNGLLCTGKGAYASNSVFLPAAGDCLGGNVGGQGDYGDYWSSTPYGSNDAYRLDFNSGFQFVNFNERYHSFSVRAVLAEFVFEEASGSTTTGSAKRTGNIDVNWVQLWENGPKFAEYNVGAENNKAEDYGGYYCWGKTTDNGVNVEYKDGESNLSGDDDTATKLWGSAWRMPTSVELEALINSTNCTVEWIDGTNRKYNNTTVEGLLCTGKGAYASNSVFLPAAGYCLDDGNVYGQGYGGGDVYVQAFGGFFWSSTPDGSDCAYVLNFNSFYQYVSRSHRSNGYSVRAVLAE